MKLFISSVITGMEDERAAVARAATLLDFDVIRAEDFSASSTSPQQTCLEGVRQADVTVLLLGERYGHPQGSGLSATHEEFREAKDHCDVIPFVQANANPDATQTTFIREVKNWDTGKYAGEFSTPEELAGLVTTALSRYKMVHADGDAEARRGPRPRTCA